MRPFENGDRVEVELVSKKVGNVGKYKATVVGVATNSEIPFLGYGFIIKVDPNQDWDDITGFDSDYTIAYSRYMTELL
ncbi:hypothetical protein AsFcp4_275 [Aeromonas phage AsFcp_4]|uniref:Uncharacterized protein n=1 Tax=Aeromonas phage PX29 TaxID=926067 RepID=E5DQ51_9CAUD|nr:hypothetical protein CL89_gp118 [Aeromonas phage PX29]ADQ52837.1 conserved hypothetical protein [Aeromonas phage PX29]QAX98384.1 hypothetical protein ASfcp2_38 [Aeromonas phage AsFcp_2]QAX99727.1 hypothetical protein AsFcp4_275 [Aeromonas phage AsFcp_4]